MNDHSFDVEQVEVKQALGYAETSNQEKDDLTKELDEAKEKIASLDETIGNIKGRLTDSGRTNEKLDSNLIESNQEIKRLTNLLSKSETNIALLK
jgi:peptidoglycan hydrolase CwlO-like protein